MTTKIHRTKTGWCGAVLAAAVLLAAPLAAKAETTGSDGIVYGEAKRSNYWMAGLSGGISFIPAKVDYGGVKGQPGPHVRLTMGHVFSDAVLIGLATEWESHGLEVTGVEIGTGHVVSILPYGEFRLPLGSDKLMAYGNAGLGANINFFKERAGLGSSVKPDPSVALRLGLGLDYEVADGTYGGLELAYKTNNTTADVGGGEANYRYNSLAIMLGFKQKF